MDPGLTVCRTWEQGAGSQNSEAMSRASSEGRWQGQPCGSVRCSGTQTEDWGEGGVGRRALYQSATFTESAGTLNQGPPLLDLQ